LRRQGAGRHYGTTNVHESLGFFYRRKSSIRAAAFEGRPYLNETERTCQVRGVVMPS
jgi:hypothetical protein